MAEEAQKEPTMEEILSSIRKIISEDEKPAAEPAPMVPAEVVVEDPVNDDFDSPAFSEVVEDDSFTSELEEDIFEAEETFETEDAFEENAFELEEVLPQLSEAQPEPEDNFAIEEPEPEPAPEPVAEIEPEVPETLSAPEPVQVEKEPEMTAAAKLDTVALTDTTTADAAAGALGQLISKMDLGGGENTIDGLVRAMLKPMIKEWLDANLQGIVESKVEAEVARIARLAR